MHDRSDFEAFGVACFSNAFIEAPGGYSCTALQLYGRSQTGFLLDALLATLTAKDNTSTGTHSLVRHPSSSDSRKSTEYLGQHMLAQM